MNSSSKFAESRFGLSSGAGSSACILTNGSSSASMTSSGMLSSSTSLSSSSTVTAAAVGNGGKGPSIAALCNLGNTCFLNSVLYTLRFTPGFLHHLHHMVQDLGLNQKSGSSKRGLGGGGGHSQSSSSSSSFLPAASHLNSDTELVLDVIEQLHDLFKALSSSDESDCREPIPPSSFLNAVGKLNPMFEGNQQQDAHELLVTLLNLLQDIKIPAAASHNAVSCTSSSVPSETVVDSGSLASSKKRSAKSGFLNSSSSSSSANTQPHPSCSQPQCNGGLEATCKLMSKIDMSMADTLPNFVKDNFIGKSVMGTRCLECETSTYRSETFTNIDIPLSFDEDYENLSVMDLFLKQIMASETLRENNKYWCGECLRLNEAQRSVQYELLPKIMVLQLKRFTATGNKNYVSKINDYIPTPFTMNCFCTECHSARGQNGSKASLARHCYRLYAVIMHVGASLASGHYIAYVRAATDHAHDYSQCQRNNNSVERKNKKSILKYFSRDNSKSSNVITSTQSNGNGIVNGLMNSWQTDCAAAAACRSVHCCGLRSLACDTHSVAVATNSSSSTFDTATSDHAGSCLPLHEAFDTKDEVWLECDDDNISHISRRQFEEELSSKQNNTTPYLLFYQRV